MVHQPCRQCRIPGQDSFRPDTISGCLCDSAYPCRPVPLGPQEMGLLDCMASGQCLPACYACLCGTRLYADCLWPLPHKRNLVTCHLVRPLQEKSLTVSQASKNLQISREHPPMLSGILSATLPARAHPERPLRRSPSSGFPECAPDLRRPARELCRR